MPRAHRQLSEIKKSYCTYSIAVKAGTVAVSAVGVTALSGWVDELYLVSGWRVTMLPSGRYEVRRLNTGPESHTELEGALLLHVHETQKFHGHLGTFVSINPMCCSRLGHSDQHSRRL